MKQVIIKETTNDTGSGYKYTNLDSVAKILFHVADLEELRNGSAVDARIVSRTHHRVGLSTSCLAISCTGKMIITSADSIDEGTTSIPMKHTLYPSIQDVIICETSL